MTKGLITIATGKKLYYQIAANLLLSYRYFSKEPLPFAIIAEEENEYTQLFDDVIITNESMHSFCDKFLLLKLCPYDETIFFDADCLAYGDLNQYWELFKNATDFSALGDNEPVNGTSQAWYNVEDIGKYGANLKYKTRIHAGVCFIRKSEKLDQMYNDCMELYCNFDKLYFHSYSASIDECVLGVAMPMNSMKATRQNNLDLIAAYPCLTKLSIDILKGPFSYTTPWGSVKNSCILMHWGTSQTHQPLYRFNVECLNALINSEINFLKGKILYKHKLRYILLSLEYYPKTFIKRVFSFLKRKIEK